MKQTEALKLALEALENMLNQYYADTTTRNDLEMADNAITAIREVLSEQTYPDNFIHALMYDVAKRDSEAQQAYEDAFVNGTGVMFGDKRIDPASIYKQPEPDNTYNYAKNLAEALFKRHFASDEHYASGRVVWGVNDTVIGILTQIDNMVADMVRRPAQQQEPVAWMHPDGRIWTFGRGLDKSTFTIPLYEHPPASKPLSDEEIWDEVKAADLDWQTGWSLDEDASNRYITFARAIEAAHGIKENT